LVNLRSSCAGAEKVGRLFRLILFFFFLGGVTCRSHHGWHTFAMGGGNAQKTAMSRQRHAAKEAEKGKGGGGKAGMEARKGGDMASAMAAAQAEREKVKQLREAKEAKKASS